MPPKKTPATWKKYAKWLLIGVAAREAYLVLGPMRQRRRDMFNLAQHRASETGKRLIVIGDPDGGIVNRFIGRDYDCGDLCIDTKGCLSCGDYLTGRPEDVLPGLETGSAVIYVSMALESVHNLDKVLAEMERVSGGDVFAATASPWTLTSLFYPGSRRQFTEAPPDQPGFRWKPHYWSPLKSDKREYPLKK